MDFASKLAERCGSRAVLSRCGQENCELSAFEGGMLSAVSGSCKLCICNVNVNANVVA